MALSISEVRQLCEEHVQLKAALQKLEQKIESVRTRANFLVLKTSGDADITFHNDHEYTKMVIGWVIGDLAAEVTKTRVAIAAIHQKLGTEETITN